jgi:hypothetical protein
MTKFPILGLVQHVIEYLELKCLSTNIMLQSIRIINIY